VTPQQLKNSILQMAMQGKLVEQRPEEGAGEELYRQIQEEKKKLIREGKIKKEKPLPEITEDEIPFEIPESWKWVRLGDISSYAQPKVKISPSQIQPDMWSLDLEDIEKDTGKVIIRVLAVNRKIQGDKVRFWKGNILYSKLRPYLLKILIAEDDGITSPELIPFNIYGCEEQRFYLWYLRSPYVDSAVNDVSYGVKMPRVGTETMVNLLVPLPPLAEQKRIVAKIGQLMPYIDQYAVAYDNLQSYNNRFPDDLKKSILQQAIQGKLVPQDPNDEPASVLLEKIAKEKQKLIKEGKIKKQKPLPEITEEEIPFEIPESWRWVRLGNVITDTEAGKSPQCKNRPATKQEWGVIKTTAIQDGYFLADENKVLPSGFQIKSDQVVHAGDLLITRAGPQNRTGVTCIVNNEPGNLILSDKTVRIRYVKGLVSENYLMYALKSPAVQRCITGAKSGMAESQVNISQNNMQLFVLPFPPLAEQKRIVAKLDELLPQIDGMK
jgi:type I restriction enzyme S subunit